MPSLFDIPPIPIADRFTDPRTGLVTTQWRAWNLAIQRALDASGGTFAPIDARFVVGQANGTLTDEINLGALASGFVVSTQAAGSASLATTFSGALLTGLNASALASGTVPDARFPSTLPALNGSNLTSLNATALASGTVPDARFPATLPAVSGANLTSLTGANITGGGTYTPTLTNALNLSASTPYACQYLRVGASVMVSGLVDVDPTTTATLTQLGVSLPIASNFAAPEQCGGTAFALGVAGQGAGFSADVANDRASMTWIAGDVTNQTMSFSFLYRVI